MARPVLAASQRSESSSASTCSVALPSHGSGDLGVIIAFHCRITDTDTLSIDQGWTPILPTFGSTANRESVMRAFAKELGATETDPVVTNDNSSSGVFVCEAYILTGATDLPGDLTSGPRGDYVGANRFSPPLPEADVPEADSLRVGMVAISNDRYNSGHSTPAGWDVIAGGNDASGDCAAISFTGDADPPTSPEVAVTNAWTGTTNQESQCDLTVVIPPGGAPPPPGDVAKLVGPGGLVGELRRLVA